MTKTIWVIPKHTRMGTRAMYEHKQTRQFNGVKEARAYAKGKGDLRVVTDYGEPVRKTKVIRQQAGFLNMPKMKMPQFGRW